MRNEVIKKLWIGGCLALLVISGGGSAWAQGGVLEHRFGEKGPVAPPTPPPGAFGPPGFAASGMAQTPMPAPVPIIMQPWVMNPNLPVTTATLGMLKLNMQPMP